MLGKMRVVSAFDTDMAPAGGMVGIRFYFLDLAVLNMDQDATFRVAPLTYRSHNFIHKAPHHEKLRDLINRTAEY